MPDAIEAALARTEVVLKVSQSGLPDVLRGVGHVGGGMIQITIWPDNADFRTAVAEHLPEGSYEFNVMPVEKRFA